MDKQKIIADMHEAAQAYANRLRAMEDEADAINASLKRMMDDYRATVADQFRAYAKRLNKEDRYAFLQQVRWNLNAPLRPVADGLNLNAQAGWSSTWKILRWIENCHACGVGMYADAHSGVIAIKQFNRKRMPCPGHDEHTGYRTYMAWEIDRLMNLRPVPLWNEVQHPEGGDRGA